MYLQRRHREYVECYHSDRVDSGSLLLTVPVVFCLFQTRFLNSQDVIELKSLRCSAAVVKSIEEVPASVV